MRPSKPAWSPTSRMKAKAWCATAPNGGKVVFVAGALPGERVSFRRVSFHRSHDEATLVEVLEPSTHRVTPRCAHFGICGGCALQHLDPAMQIQAKQKEMADNLERIGNVTPDEWLPPLLGPVWNYRRRARLSSRYVAKKARSLVGFREKQGKYVADVSRCEVLAEPVASLVGALGQLLTGMQRRESIPQIEVSLSDGERVLVLRVLDAPSTGRCRGAARIRTHPRPAHPAAARRAGFGRAADRRARSTCITASRNSTCAWISVPPTSSR